MSKEVKVTKESKVVVLMKDPEKFISDNEEWWKLNYAPKWYFKRFPEYPYWSTAVTKKHCPEVEHLKKGDRLKITIELPTGKVVKIEVVRNE
jgi:hypothetical protein